MKVPSKMYFPLYPGELGYHLFSVDEQTGWSIKKFVRTARRYRTVTIQAGGQTLTAAEPPSGDLAEALAKNHGAGVH